DVGNGAVRYANLSDHPVRAVGVDVAPGAIETVVGPNPLRVRNDDPPQAGFEVGPACNVGENYNLDGPIQDGRDATAAQICPKAIALAPNGDLFVLASSNHGALYRVDSRHRL